MFKTTRLPQRNAVRTRTAIAWLSAFSPNAPFTKQLSSFSAKADNVSSIAPGSELLEALRFRGSAGPLEIRAFQYDAPMKQQMPLSLLKVTLDGIVSGRGGSDEEREKSKLPTCGIPSTLTESLPHSLVVLLDVKQRRHGDLRSGRNTIVMPRDLQWKVHSPANPCSTVIANSFKCARSSK